MCRFRGTPADRRLCSSGLPPLPLGSALFSPHSPLAVCRYYARRWVSPTGAAGARLQQWLQVRVSRARLLREQPAAVRRHGRRVTRTQPGRL